MKHQTKPNSWIYQDTAATTQLSYALQIDPAPFTVSIPGQNPVIGSLEFVVTNPTGSTINVTSVAFNLPVGSASDCITQTTSGILTASNDTVNWNIVGPASPVTSGIATYTLQPASGNPFPLPAGASVVVQIFGFQTITVPGNSTISIKEITSTVSFASFIVTTFPTGFYFNSLSATVQSGSSLVPAAQIKTGSTVTLTWNSSVVDTSAFTIYYSNAASGQQTAKPSDVGEWTSPALSSDTIFTVAVTISAEGGQPLTAALTTGISVQNPSLVAAAITTGTASITGAASVGGALTANAISSTGITVNGGLSSGSATVSGAVTAGSVGVSNGLTAASANVSGALTTGSATVNNALTANTVSSPAITTNALTVNSIINSSGGANMNGIINLAGSNGNVGVGGTVYNTCTLTVTNTQTTGYGVYLNAPYLNSGAGWWSLYVQGSCANSTGSWVQASDITLKDRVKPYKDGLAKVLKINPIKFHFNKDSGLNPKKEYVGVSAQELKEIAPYMVSKGRISPDSKKEYLHMDKGAMTYMLINAVKELNAKVTKLEEELKKLKKK